jgi:hypothetical protein
MTSVTYEEGNRSSFRVVSFYSYLEYRTMDKVQKRIDSECYTSSSEPFRVYHRVLELVSDRIIETAKDFK